MTIHYNRKAIIMTRCRHTRKQQDSRNPVQTVADAILLIPVLIIEGVFHVFNA